MRMGYELIKEQLFFRKELIERVAWFIHLRWLFVCAGFVGSIAGYLMWHPFPHIFFLTVFLCIAVYNIVFYRIYVKLSARPSQDEKTYALFAHSQIVLDLSALGLIIHFTGGVYSPFLFFILFHIIIAGILLSPASCFVYGGIMPAVLGTTVLLQHLGLLARRPVLFSSPSVVHASDTQTLFLLIIDTAVILVTAALTTTIKISLRIKGRELLSVSKELTAQNKKLNALYELVKEMGMRTGLQELMDAATRQGTQIMGVKACAIKLLDDQRRKLRFVSTYGLSGDYIAKGTVDIEKSIINRKIIEGSVYAIGQIHEKDQFQYPEEMQKEGIASMVCLPLRVEKMIFGVFCVYSDIPNAFLESDIRFFSLMSDLTAIFIENLKSELNKTWFLQKTAHQLRSPLNAVHSMLKTMRKGYIGGIDPRQEETLMRCEKRIEGLGSLIGDLLGLSIRRAGMDQKKMVPVNIGQVVERLLLMYRAQADEKSINILHTIPESLPDVLGDNMLFDDLFTNLISNAVNYTQKGGSIQIAFQAEAPGRVRCVIKDTGIGIPEEEVPHLFTEFFRGQNAKATTEEGTGLGLVIVKEILDQLNGTIQVESTVGKGTCLTLRLPAVG